MLLFRNILFILMGCIMLEGCGDKNEIVLIADPRVIAVPVVDNNEPMVNLTNQAELAYGPSPEVPNNTDYTKMRKTVYDMVIAAQKKLPKGLRFCIYESYRSLALQKMLFDNRYNKLKALYPEWTPEYLFNQTTVLVSPVVNLDGSHNVPPHSTGGAIDIYLVDENNHPVEMGIHPADWIDDKDGSVSATQSTHISAEAKQNRKIMSDALRSVGFVNYPTEYWHWSYGDRYWAYQSHHDHAIYGSI